MEPRDLNDAQLQLLAWLRDKGKPQTLISFEAGTIGFCKRNKLIIGMETRTLDATRKRGYRSLLVYDLTDAGREVLYKVARDTAWPKGDAP